MNRKKKFNEEFTRCQYPQPGWKLLPRAGVKGQQLTGALRAEGLPHPSQGHLSPTTSALSDDGVSSSRKSGDPCPRRCMLGPEMEASDGLVLTPRVSSSPGGPFPH